MNDNNNFSVYDYINDFNYMNKYQKFYNNDNNYYNNDNNYLPNNN